MPVYLWYVVVIFGKIFAVTGPLPYGMEECASRNLEKSLQLDQQFQDPAVLADPKLRINGRQITRADITLHCYAASERPVAGERWTVTKVDP